MKGRDTAWIGSIGIKSAIAVPILFMIVYVSIYIGTIDLQEVNLFHVKKMMPLHIMMIFMLSYGWMVVVGMIAFILNRVSFLYRIAPYVLTCLISGVVSPLMLGPFVGFDGSSDIALTFITGIIFAAIYISAALVCEKMASIIFPRLWKWTHK